jgi:hypothetical protein
MNYADQACLLKSLSLLPGGNVRCIPIKSLLVANAFFQENRTFPAFKADFPRLYVVSPIAFVMGRD